MNSTIQLHITGIKVRYNLINSYRSPEEKMVSGNDDVAILNMRKTKEGR